MHERNSEPAPGPGPEDAPGLESGGSVQPGDTPPDAGTSDSTGHGAPPAKSSNSAKPLFIFGVIGIVLLVFVFVGYIAGIIA